MIGSHGVKRLAGVAVSLLLVASVSLVYYRERYNVWPGSALPGQLHSCGHQYDQGANPPVDAISLHEVDAFAPVLHSRIPIFAKSDRCDSQLYLQTPTGELVGYGIKGAPFSYFLLK